MSLSMIISQIIIALSLVLIGDEHDTNSNKTSDQFLNLTQNKSMIKGPPTK